MASWKEEKEEDLGSLFDGMVLIDPFSSTSLNEHTITSVGEKGGGKDADDDESPIILPLPTDSQQIIQQSEPLDENLFSDLTLAQTLVPDETPDDNNNHTLPITTTTTTTTTATTTTTTSDALSSRQQQHTTTSSSSSSSRRKRRGGFRIGYARDTPDPHDTKFKSPPPPFPSDDDNNNLKIHESTTPPPLPYSDPDPNLHVPHEPPPLASPDIFGIPSSENNKYDKSATAQGDKGDPHKLPSVTVTDQVTNDDDDIVAATDIELLQIKHSQQQQQQEQEEVEQQQQQQLDPCCSIEEKLKTARRHISQKLERIREAASSLSTARKESVRRRRKTAEDVNSASLHYKDLEKELEEACGAEDFERAERVSEKLAAAEKDKEAFMEALREAEAECRSVESKMQEVLELQISTEEEGAAMLEAFARVNSF